MAPLLDWVAPLLDCWCGSGEIDFVELKRMMKKIKKQMLPSSLDAYKALADNQVAMPWLKKRPGTR